MERGLTFEDVAKIDDRPLEAVPVPEWGGVVYLRPMTIAAYQALRGKYGGRGAAKDIEGQQEYETDVFAACWCDEKGQQIELNDDRLGLLRAEKNAAVIVRLFKRCDALCGLTAEGEKELEKN